MKNLKTGILSGSLAKNVKYDPSGERPQEAKMRKSIKLRTLTTEEVTTIKRLAASREEPIRLVQRVRVIAFM